PAATLRTFFIYRYAPPRYLHSFPTRRSSDLAAHFIGSGKLEEAILVADDAGAEIVLFDQPLTPAQQRNLERGFNRRVVDRVALRSEEHTSELQSRENLVCRLLLEKKKNKKEK